MSVLKQQYIEFIHSKQYFLNHKKKDDLRVATYNIRYWTDAFDNNTLKKIISDIKYINADILCLQEVIFGIKYKVANNIINTEHVIHTLHTMGYYTLFCNTLPTWFGGIYGNMICIKQKYIDQITPTNFTFDKSEKTCFVSGTTTGTKETRCYILLEYLNYIIICVHLDVCSEQERKKQIKHIIHLLNHNKYKNKKIIILGDFNTTDIHQYEDKDDKKDILKFVFNNNRYTLNNNVISMLYKENFKSATDSLDINITVWSKMQTDYIFTKNIMNITPQILYTDASDHLPVIMDISN